MTDRAVSKQNYENKNGCWGVIRYAPGSGAFCSDDAAGFDGWYFIRSWAEEVYEDWLKSYPDWTVAIVSQEAAAYPDRDFSGHRNVPLTKRERHFAQTRGRT